MFTASHNPAQLQRDQALPRRAPEPIGVESPASPRSSGWPTTSTRLPPATERRAPLDHAGPARRVGRPTCTPSSTSTALRPLHDRRRHGQRHGGFVAPLVFAGLPFEVEVLYPELDGTFPNHPADPIQPGEPGRPAGGACSRRAPTSGSPSTATPTGSSSSTRRPSRSRGSTHHGDGRRGRCSKAPRRDHPLQLHLLEGGARGDRRERAASACARASATPTSSRSMAETGAVFGGEHSGHYYFRDNYRADSGIIAALVVLELLSTAGGPLSELLASPSSATPTRARSTPRSPTRRRPSRRVAARLAAEGGAVDRPPRRADRRLRDVVVQPAALEHRAAAAPERGGRDRRGRARRHVDEVLRSWAS